jgi:hypothetical protein
LRNMPKKLKKSGKYIHLPLLDVDIDVESLNILNHIHLPIFKKL